jgi:hypothetical protein
MKIRALHDRVIVKRLEEDRTSPGGMARRCDGRHNLAFYDMSAARLMCAAVRSTRFRATMVAE